MDLHDWTISQIRPHYKWKEGDKTHRATVIQTQTAFNPGNSGGPLLNNQAQLIGINSFQMEGKGLSYAIAGDTVKQFLKGADSQLVEAPKKSAEEITRVDLFGDHMSEPTWNLQLRHQIRDWYSEPHATRPNMG
jgi:S1-C subfamily serine protease